MPVVIFARAPRTSRPSEVGTAGQPVRLGSRVHTTSYESTAAAALLGERARGSRDRERRASALDYVLHATRKRLSSRTYTRGLKASQEAARRPARHLLARHRRELPDAGRLRHPNQMAIGVVKALFPGGRPGDGGSGVVGSTTSSAPLCDLR